MNIQQKAHERARKEWKKLSYCAKERGQSEHCLSRLHFVIHCFFASSLPSSLFQY